MYGRGGVSACAYVKSGLFVPWICEMHTQSSKLMQIPIDEKILRQQCQDFPFYEANANVELSRHIRVYRKVFQRLYCSEIQQYSHKVNPAVLICREARGWEKLCINIPAQVNLDSCQSLLDHSWNFKIDGLPSIFLRKYANNQMRNKNSVAVDGSLPHLTCWGLIWFVTSSLRIIVAGLLSN